MELSKRYEPAQFERDIYAAWEKAGVFKPRPGKTKKTFYLPIPPPNVTGVLHMGHAQTLSLEDLMVRYHRMKGDETLWVPGTDHAGISTQAVVEKNLAKEGKRRTELGREKFTEEVWKWKDFSHKTITDQVRQIGASCDWSRERFTLDPELNKLVEHSFVELYERGLLYRGEYMVNYSPALKTVVSSEEVILKEEDGFLYEVIYFISGSDKELVVATTRPETLLGDQAIAVHPKDKRFKKLIGRTVILPIVNKEIPVIGDESVDMEFGTGAVKVTPAHDPTDFETGKRHKLRLDYSVIDQDGNMNANAGQFRGLPAATEARQAVVAALKAKGNLKSVAPYKGKVSYCERSGCRIESVVSTQWFVRVADMVKKVMAGWKSGDFTIVPDRFGKVFEDWMGNLNDWCVSRQLWWGHRIPAYYDVKTGKLLAVSIDEKAVQKKFGKDNVRRDDDVLDTWFSSATWPYSVLGWDPEKPAADFKKFYPAQVLETGHDIIFFWVVRMLLFGYEFTGQTPFKTVYLHGMVMDEHGKKMSKSKGNGVDPLAVIAQHSADALRLSTVVGATPGNNMNFSVKLVENNMLFLNKLWNVARFVAMNSAKVGSDCEKLANKLKKGAKTLLPHERWILSRLDAVVAQVTFSLEGFSFSQAGEVLERFTRDEFADYFVEAAKIAREETKLGDEVAAYAVLTILKMWHPYVPFITEKMWSEFFGGEGFIAQAAWPEPLGLTDEAAEKAVGAAFDVVRAVRALRVGKNIKPGEPVDVVVVADKALREALESASGIVAGLAKVAQLKFVPSDKGLDAKSWAFAAAGRAVAYLDVRPFAASAGEEIERLGKLIEDKKAYVRSMELRLTDAAFVKNAPERVVKMQQEKLTIERKNLETAIAQLAHLKS